MQNLRDFDIHRSKEQKPEGHMILWGGVYVTTEEYERLKVIAETRKDSTRNILNEAISLGLSLILDENK